MNHSIKVRGEVYEKLQKLQRPRESYSEVIERLLMITEPLLEASRLLGASHYLKEYKHGPEEIRDLQVR